ncbi:MAG: UDP-N-acetylglucosamine--N-acetylmuramyl-(pentapeptide) pyrophosphoryl-undecaprenol N-acetylglucosamine transferase [Gemmatimonadaceae bacterium]|nr:UDP-N-acetylglucosamine--N-acetylmuramyl-(pentapeptide) pyrophosphoryl-undecaprenol N-acetylglucosamine transferase [Gemmatimonadaceae bacterium]
MRVFFTGGGTGGHLYPALAIARALVQVRPDVEPHFIGARRGLERDVLPSTGFPHTLLDLYPLYRAAPWRNVATLRGLVSGWRTVAGLAASERPRLVVATGGYASSATLAYARVRGIPFVLQESNAFPGKTVVWFSRWAREIYASFPEVARRLPGQVRERVIDVGNPIEPPPAPRPDRGAARAEWGFDATVTTVALVVGGSQGSAALNALVDAWIAGGLPPGVGVIWGTGKAHYTGHAGRESSTVRVRPYLAPIAEAYAAADVAVSRAGSITAELCAWGIPMYLVPLPTAAADHQTANARALGDAGAAAWISEREATPAALNAFVQSLSSNPARRRELTEGALRRARPDAAHVIATRLDVLLRSRV